MVVLGLAGPGCATLPDSERSVGEGDSGVEGRVAFQFVTDRGRAGRGLSDQQVLMAPSPLETPLPGYPQGALVKDAAPATVMVRIFIEADGTVHEVVDSPLQDSPPGAAGDPFRAAVEEAVRAWKFVPGRVRTLTEGEDIDGDGKPDYRFADDETPIRTYLDVRFKFDVVGGKGQVRLE
jgi:hypothetical protein